MAKIAPQPVAPKVPWESIDKLQLADKLFLKKGKDVTCAVVVD